MFRTCSKLDATWRRFLGNCSKHRTLNRSKIAASFTCDKVALESSTKIACVNRPLGFSKELKTAVETTSPLVLVSKTASRFQELQLYNNTENITAREKLPLEISDYQEE